MVYSTEGSRSPARSSWRSEALLLAFQAVRILCTTSLTAASVDRCGRLPNSSSVTSILIRTAFVAALA